MHVSIDGTELHWPARPSERLVEDEILDYHRGWIASDLFGGEKYPDKVKFHVYTARDLESAEDLMPATLNHSPGLLPPRKVTVDRFGQYQIQNSPGPAWVMKTLPLYIEDEVSNEQRVKDHLRFISIKDNELPIYHFYDGYTPKGTKTSTNHGSSAVQGPDEEFLTLVNQVPRTEGQRIDLLFEQNQAKLDAAAAEDPKNKLRHKPDILPTDAAYVEAEIFFTNVLNSMNANRKMLLEVIEDEFEVSQQLLLKPAIEYSQCAVIQQENSVLYRDVLNKRFKGKIDNAVTKMAMLRFGLPIAPLNKTNAVYAGTKKDVLKPEDNGGDDDDDDDDLPEIETMIYEERPLEFLDFYHRRHYGYPLIHTPKHYNLDDSKTTQAKIKVVKEALKSAEPNAPNDPKCSASIHRGKTPENSNQAQFNSSLRGGASDELRIHTDMGIFNVSTGGKGLRINLQRLAMRIFRINMVVAIEIDVFPHNQEEQAQTWHHTSTDTSELLNTTATWLQTQLVDRDGDQDVRLRPAGVGSIDSPILLTGVGLDAIELERRDTGAIAYWYIPLSADRKQPLVGVNKRYETLRNAVECLEVLDFQWTVNEGQIDQKSGVLYGDTPAIDLWDAVLEEIEKITKTGDNGRVRVVIDNLAKADELRIFIPGPNHKYIAPSIPNAAFAGQSAHKTVFTAIREAVMDRYPYLEDEPTFQDMRILVWQGTVDFKKNRKPHSIPILEHASDATIFANGDWAKLLETPPIDALVVLPELAPFMIQDDKGNKVEWPAIDPSLESFRDALVRLWPTHYPEKDSITIHQPHRLGANNEFLIEPEMDEIRWNLQVYSWLCDSNIHVSASNAQPLRYSKLSIDGPLWSVISGEVSPALATSATPPDLQAASQQPSASTAATQTHRYQQHVLPNTTSSSTNAISNGSGKMAWLDWIAKKDRISDSRQAVYTQPQIIGGPSGGQVLQLGSIAGSSTRGGPHVPSTISTTMSRSQIIELEKKVRSLQNLILDRETGCQMCMATFPKGPPGPEDFKAHLQVHITQLKNHRCPYCQVDDWRDWSDDERLAHIQTHANTSFASSSATSGLAGHSSGIQTQSNNNRTLGTCHFCRTETANMNTQQLHDHYLTKHFPSTANGIHGRKCGFLLANGATCQHSLAGLTVWAEIVNHYHSHLPCEHCGLPGNEMGNRVHHVYGHLTEAQRYCTFPECHHQFNDGDNENLHREHFRTHLHDVAEPSSSANIASITTIQCPMAGCQHGFRATDNDKSYRAHFRTHLKLVCIFPRCSHRFDQGDNDDVHRAHLRTHLPNGGVLPAPLNKLSCYFPDCNHQFQAEDDEEVYRDHFQTHLIDEDIEASSEAISEPASDQAEAEPSQGSETDEEYSEDEIPEDAVDVAMPQRKIDEAEAVGRRWRCPHDALLAMKRGKSGKAPHNLIDQKHLHRGDKMYPRIASHSEWLLVGEGTERDDLFAERNANRKVPGEHTPLKVAIKKPTPNKATPKTKIPRKSTPDSISKKTTRRKKRTRSPELVAGDGTLDIEGEADDEDSLAQSGMSTSTRNATKRKSAGTNADGSNPSKKQKTV